MKITPFICLLIALFLFGMAHDVMHYLNIPLKAKCVIVACIIFGQVFFEKFLDYLTSKIK